MATGTNELRVARPRQPQLATPEAETGNPRGNSGATPSLKSLAYKVLARNRPGNSGATEAPATPQLTGDNNSPQSCPPATDLSEDAYADFLHTWRQWIGGQPVGAWELIVAMDRGFAPRRFVEAAEALFGELPQTPYDLGGYLAPYRGLGAVGCRLETETITNGAGERIRRYRVTGNTP